MVIVIMIQIIAHSLRVSKLLRAAQQCNDGRQ